MLTGRDVLETDVSGHGCNPGQRTNPLSRFSFFPFFASRAKAFPRFSWSVENGVKLTLSGRSPIEHVEQPRDIPKPIARFYSGAVVAHQSGQTLAGVFLFRVLIEQWAQSQASTSGLRADSALEEYMEGLPNDFKGRFPSFRALYERLSADIHSATGSADLFEEARQRIAEHFEARRVFKLPKK